MQNTNDQFIHQSSMRDVFIVVFKHKFMIIFFFLTATVIAVMSALLAPKVYQSEAKLFIKLGKEVVTQSPTDSPGQRVQVSQSLENQINSEIEILTSQELAQNVVAAIGADAFQKGSEKYASFEDPLIKSLRLKIIKLLEFPKNAVAQFLKPPSIPAESASPTTNEEIAGMIYQNLKAEVVKDSNIIKLYYETRDPYLARDVLNLLISLYLEKHNNLVGTQGTFDFLKKESDRLMQQLESTEKKLADLKSSAGSESSSSTTAELQKVLYNLKQKEQELLSTFTANSIPVKEIRRQVAEAENDLQKHLQRINSAAVQITQLERKKELIEENYRKYTASLEQTRIDQAMEEEKISNIRVIQAPTVPIEPIRPNTGLIILMGLFFAVFGSLALAFFTEYTDNSLQWPEQVEEILRLPVLGSIQKMEK